MRANKYFATQQFRALNMVICKVGTTAGTATTGDVMIIPATQLAPVLPTGVTNNPLPTSVSTDPLSSARASMVTACNSVNPAIIAGADAYLGTMNFISNADTALADVIPDADYPGTSSNVALPTGFAVAMNDNTATSKLFDIVAKTDATTTWVIGAAALDALL
jgi:hypothetical protein